MGRTSLPLACSFASSSSENVDIDTPFTRWLSARLRGGARLASARRAACTRRLGLRREWHRSARAAARRRARTVRWRSWRTRTCQSSCMRTAAPAPATRVSRVSAAASLGLRPATHQRADADAVRALLVRRQLQQLLQLPLRLGGGGERHGAKQRPTLARQARPGARPRHVRTRAAPQAHAVGGGAAVEGPKQGTEGRTRVTSGCARPGSQLHHATFTPAARGPTPANAAGGQRRVRVARR